MPRSQNILLAAALVILMGSSALAQDFQQKLDQISSRPQGAVSPANFVELIQEGINQGDLIRLGGLVDNYLRQNPEPGEEMFLWSARLAALQGNMRAAAGRYKQYLDVAPVNAQSQQAAGELFSILVYYLQDADDAYRSIQVYPAFSGNSPFSSGHNLWLASQAEARKDIGVLSTAVQRALEYPMPLAQRQSLVWPLLNSLVTIALSDPNAAADEAQALRSLAQASPDAAWQKRILVLADFFTYRQTLLSELKKEEADRSEDPLASQRAAFVKSFGEAQAAFNTGQGLVQLLLWTFRTPGTFDQEVWQAGPDAIQSAFASAFPKLPEDEKKKFAELLDLQHPSLLGHLATAQGWLELILASPVAFTNAPVLAKINYALPKEIDALRTLAGITLTVESPRAAAVSALAKGGKPEEVARRLAESESWRIPFQPSFSALGILIPHYREQEGWAGTVENEMFFQFSTAAFSQSIVAIYNLEEAKRFLGTAWSLSTDAGKIKFGQALNTLGWLPWDPKAREELFSGLKAGITGWEAALNAETSEVSAQDKTQAEATIALYNRLVAGEVLDTANPFLRTLRAFVQASATNNQAEFDTTGKAALAALLAQDPRKMSFPSASWQVLTATEGVNNAFALRLEILETLLRREDIPWSTPARVQLAVDSIARAEEWVLQHGRLQAAPNQKANALVVADAVGAILTEQIEAAKINPRLIPLYQSLLEGKDWQERERGLPLVRKLIESGNLHRTNFAPGAQSVTDWEMQQVLHTYPELQEEFPLATFFEDRMAAGIRTAGTLNGPHLDSYFTHRRGRDDAGKILSAVLEIVKQWESLPLSQSGLTPLLSASDLANLQARAAFQSNDGVTPWLDQLNQWYGKTRFDVDAAGYLRLERPSTLLPSGEEDELSMDRNAFFQDLANYLDRAAGAPNRFAAPSLQALKAMVTEEAPLTDEEFSVLGRMFITLPPTSFRNSVDQDTFLLALLKHQVEKKDWKAWTALVPVAWQTSKVPGNPNLQTALAQMAREAGEAGDQKMAAILSVTGIQLLTPGISDILGEQLARVRSQSFVAMGVAVPVAEGHPNFGPFSAQAAYSSGSLDEAWRLFEIHKDRIWEIAAEMDAAFLVWTVEEMLRRDQVDMAMQSIRTLSPIFDQYRTQIPVESQARLALAAAEISIAQREYAQARAQLQRLLSEAEWEGTQARDNALLQLADVERMTRNYDVARTDLERHSREGSDFLRTEALYHLAVLLIEMEEFSEATRALRGVFARAPHHPEARILEGRLNVLTGRYIEATEIPIGFAEAQRHVIPGRPLRIRLEDDNLAVVGASRAIEVRVWTDHGDEEVVRLLPIGDSRTRFDVQVATALGEAKSDDNVLQLLGETKIFYDFSDAFKSLNNIVSKPSEVEVASDARLLVSSGEILTDDELMLQAVQQQLLADEGSRAAEVALSLERAPDQVRPGGSINIEVEDPVQSVSPNPDTVQVTVTTGERQTLRVALQETGGATGIFAGTVPTDRTPPFAFASDTEVGYSPNAVIEPGASRPWMGQWDNQRPKILGVDLQENLPLGQIVLEANEAGRKLRAWRLEVAADGRNYRPVATWPDALEAWDGRPRVSLVGLAPHRPLPANRQQINDYLESTRLLDDRARLEFAHWPEDSVHSVVNEHNSQLNVVGGNAIYAGVWNTGLFIPETGTLTLRLKQEGEGRAERIYFTVNREQVEPRSEEPLQTTRSFAKGAIPIEVTFATRLHHNLNFTLEWDYGQTGEFVPVPKEYLDPEKHPEVARFTEIIPVTVTANDETARFQINLNGEVAAQTMRFVLLDFEGDAPAVNRILLSDAEGKAILPLAPDAYQTADGATLFIAPGDQVTVIYEDTRNLSERTRQLDRTLTATYHNADINAVFSRYVEGRGGEEEELLVPARRYLPGDGLNIIVHDPDADVLPAPEVVIFEAVTESGEKLKVEAKETGAHTGVFMARIFPVLETEDARPNALTVQPGEAITLRYFDEWNSDPGVSISRESIVEQAVPGEPEIRLFQVESVPVEGDVPASDESEVVSEYFPPVRELTLIRPSENQAGSEAMGHLDVPLQVEILFPYAARAPDSEVQVFLQAESAWRASLAETEDAVGSGGFDTEVPGTIRLTAFPAEFPRLGQVPFYQRTRINDPLSGIPALDAGRFTLTLPVLPGEVPSKSLVGLSETDSGEENVLHLPGGDSIRLGVRYEDEDGNEKWTSLVVRPTSDVFLDVMDRQYRELLEAAQVGDRIYLRVVDRKNSPGAEAGPITVAAINADGKEFPITLMESVPHSGIFRTPIQLLFAGEWIEGKEGIGNELPVRHGDQLRLVYRDRASGEVLVERSLKIPMGVDAEVQAFSKQFRDGQMGVNTLFTMAEAHYELAKRHREVENQGAARRHIEQGRRILEEGLRDFPESENRDQAEYLLANLSLELASMAENEQIKQTHFQEALLRLNEVVALYPDSTYAPMAQFRKGILFEQMGESDQASEEYVRLSYRYPDSPLVGETITRLGQYFLSQGRAIQEKAGAETDPAQAELLKRESVQSYTTAAEVFSRLSIRFPNHALAQRADVLSGQCYLRAENDSSAMKQFERVANNADSEPAVRSEALYWLADIHARTSQPVEAFRIFTQITWDYPESEWARYARGRLTEPEIARGGASQ